MTTRYLCIAISLLCGQISQAQAQEPDPQESSYTAHTTLNPEIPVDQLKILVKPLTRNELKVESDAWFKLLRSKALRLAAVRLGVKKANEALASDDDQSARDSLRVAESINQTVDEIAETEEQSVTTEAQQYLGVDEDAVEDSSDTRSSPQESSSSDDQVDVVDTAVEMKDSMLADVTVLQDERTAISDRLEVVLDSLEAKGGDVEEYRAYAAEVSGIELDTSDATAAWSGITGWITSREGGQRMAWNFARFLTILLITYFIARMVAKVVNWLLERKIRLSQLAERLISRTIKNVVMLIGFAIALTALEIDITPVVAAIGATGLVVGLALQGTLSNFASGLMILINRPFDIGNVVTAGGVTGTIAQMNLVSSTFRTFDNQTIHVPNNEIWNNVITNITANPTRRVDMEFGIGYEDDFEQAETLIKEVLEANELVLSDPEPVVVTHSLAESSVNIVCRPWAKTSDWWQVKTDVTREVKRRFDQAGISIPYPQQGIHVHNLNATG